MQTDRNSSIPSFIGDSYAKRLGVALGFAIVVVLRSVYPVVWLLAEVGIGLMDVETAALVIVYLDVVTKGGFGAIALQAWITIDDDRQQRRGRRRSLIRLAVTVRC